MLWHTIRCDTVQFPLALTATSRYQPVRCAVLSCAGCTVSYVHSRMTSATSTSWFLTSNHCIVRCTFHRSLHHIITLPPSPYLLLSLTPLSSIIQCTYHPSQHHIPHSLTQFVWSGCLLQSVCLGGCACALGEQRVRVRYRDGTCALCVQVHSE